MNLNQILALLDGDIAVLKQARAILVCAPTIETYPRRRVAAKRRKLSAEAKAEIHALVRKRLAEAERTADLKEKGRRARKKKEA